MNNGNGVYIVIANQVFQTFYRATGLLFGTTYKFRVEAKTSYAYSTYSEVLTLLCATKPLQPELPQTTISTNTCVINWLAPSGQGSPIISYKVQIRTKGLDFILDTNVCDGGSPYSISTLSCIVPLDTLRATPYNLEYNDGIWARVIATNLYGDSI